MRLVTVVMLSALLVATSMAANDTMLSPGAYGDEYYGAPYDDYNGTDPYIPPPAPASCPTLAEVVDDLTMGLNATFDIFVEYFNATATAFPTSLAGQIVALSSNASVLVPADMALEQAGKDELMDNPQEMKTFVEAHIKTLPPLYDTETLEAWLNKQTGLGLSMFHVKNTVGVSASSTSSYEDYLGSVDNPVWGTLCSKGSLIPIKNVLTPETP